MPGAKKNSRSAVGKPGYIWLLLIAGLVILGAIWLSTSRNGEETSAGVVTIDTRERAPSEVPQVANTRPPAAAMPEPFSATPEVLAALRLPPGSVFRATTTPDADDGVTCGQVSSSEGDRRFRRFVYIASARAGYVDDGGEMFNRISAASCMKR